MKVPWGMLRYHGILLYDVKGTPYAPRTLIVERTTLPCCRITVPADTCVCWSAFMSLSISAFCVWSGCMSMFVYIDKCRQSKSWCRCIHVYMRCTCIHVYMRVFSYMHIPFYEYVCMYMYMHMYMYLYMCIYTCVHEEYIHMYICIYMYMHRYMHVYVYIHMCI